MCTLIFGSLRITAALVVLSCCYNLRFTPVLKFSLVCKTASYYLTSQDNKKVTEQRFNFAFNKRMWEIQDLQHNLLLASCTSHESLFCPHQAVGSLRAASMSKYQPASQAPSSGTYETNDTESVITQQQSACFPTKAELRNTDAQAFALWLLFREEARDAKSFPGRRQSIFRSDSEVLLARREPELDEAIDESGMNHLHDSRFRCANIQITAPVSPRIPRMPSDHPAHPRFHSPWG